MDLAAKALEKIGHEVVEVEFPYFEELVVVFLKVMSSKGKFREVYDIVQDEPLMEEFKLMEKISVLPDCIKYLIGVLLNCKGEKRKAKLILSNRMKTVPDYFSISSQQ